MFCESLTTLKKDFLVSTWFFSKVDMPKLPWKGHGPLRVKRSHFAFWATTHACHGRKSQENRREKHTQLELGSGFKHVSFVTPTWGHDPIWQAYFLDGLVQPPTSENWGTPPWPTGVFFVFSQKNSIDGFRWVVKMNCCCVRFFLMIIILYSRL